MGVLGAGIGERQGGRAEAVAEVALPVQPVADQLANQVTIRRDTYGVPHILADSEEAAAFARLPPPPARDVERVAHLVLMQLLPALVDDDLASFGAALTEVQRVTGGWFAPAQGGVFAPGPTGELVERLREGGAPGVGQSSWGPAVYGIVGDEELARRLAERVRSVLGPRGSVFAGGFSAAGARVWRGARPVSSRNA